MPGESARRLNESLAELSRETHTPPRRSHKGSSVVVMTDPHRLLVCHEFNGRDDLTPLFLQHPKYGVKCQYLRTPDAIFEVQKVSGEKGSWFIYGNVEPDGGLFVATRVDPLFLLLPHLTKSRRRKTKKDTGMFVPLDQIISLGEAAFELFKLPGVLEGLGHICETRMGWDDKVYRLSDKKLLGWLKAKVSRIRSGFPLLTEERLATANAIGILSEYLPDTVFMDLVEEHKMSKTFVYPKKRKVGKYETQVINGERGEVSNGPAKGRAGAMSLEKKQQIHKKKLRREKEQGKFKKMAAGSKSIMSFFSKKSRA